MSAIFRWGITDKSDLVGRVRRLEGAYPKVHSGSPVFSGAKVMMPASRAVQPDGLIAVSGISPKGNLRSYVVAGHVGFSATPTAITIYWDGTNGSSQLVMKRSDGTNFTVPAGSQTVTGLTASTQYGFSIYWQVANAAGLSFGPGDSGSPQLAISPSASTALINAALQAQQQSIAEAVYSGIAYSSTTSGGTVVGPPTTSAGAAISATRVRGFNLNTD